MGGVGHTTYIRYTTYLVVGFQVCPTRMKGRLTDAYDLHTYETASGGWGRRKYER